MGDMTHGSDGIKTASALDLPEMLPRGHLLTEILQPPVSICKEPTICEVSTMQAEEWREMMTILLNEQESGYKRSRAFSRFLKTEAHLLHLDLVARMLADHNHPFRNEAIRQVVRNMREDYYPILAHVLEEGDDHMVREALRGLETCHDPEIISKVEALKNTAVSSVHYDAERTLRKMLDGAQPWETLAAEPRQPVQTQNREPAKAFSKEKTAELNLNLNMLPTDTPYPVHRSGRSKRHASALNANSTVTQTSSNYAEAVIAVLASLTAALLVGAVLFLA